MFHPGLAAILAIASGLAAWAGAAARPELVQYPFWDSLIAAICTFVLFIPLFCARRSIDDFFSPEVMGGLAFLVWVGFGTIANLAFPGESVNPELLDDLPLGMAAQTLGAMAFYLGARAAAWKAGPAVNQETNFLRLSAAMALYGVFCLYVSFFMPRITTDEIYERVANEEEVPMLVGVATAIVFQTVPMLVAVVVYYRKFAPWGFYLSVPFVYNLLLSLASGARREAVWALLAMLSAYVLAKRKISRTLACGVGGVACLAILAGTAIRMNSDDVSATNLAGQDLRSMVENVQIATSAGRGREGDLYHALVVDTVYHFADAHTMAYLLKSNDRPPLLGEVTLEALLSALPSAQRPRWYENPVLHMADHYRLYKQPSVDSGKLTDWEVSIAVWGYADFGWAGLVAYPLALGFLLRRLYQASVLSGRFGEAGWVVYVPFLQQLWFLHNYGPAFLQQFRFLAILIVIGMCCTNRRQRQSSLSDIRQPPALRLHGPHHSTVTAPKASTSTEALPCD